MRSVLEAFLLGKLNKLNKANIRLYETLQPHSLGWFVRHNKPFIIKSSRVAAMMPFLNSRNRSITLKGLFSSFLLTSSTVTRSSEQQESIVSPRDKIGLAVIKLHGGQTNHNNKVRQSLTNYNYKVNEQC